MEVSSKVGAAVQQCSRHPRPLLSHLQIAAVVGLGPGAADLQRGCVCCHNLTLRSIWQGAWLNTAAHAFPSQHHTRAWQTPVTQSFPGRLLTSSMSCRDKRQRRRQTAAAGHAPSTEERRRSTFPHAHPPTPCAAGRSRLTRSFHSPGPEKRASPTDSSRFCMGVEWVSD